VGAGGAVRRRRGGAAQGGARGGQDARAGAVLPAAGERAVEGEKLKGG